jgi:hypothetical protein
MADLDPFTPGTALPPDYSPTALPDAGAGDVAPFTDKHGSEIDRARFAKELQDNPQLRAHIMAVSAGENLDPRSNLSVLESMMNRASMMGTTLAQESRLSPYGGYYAGYNPSALNNPRTRSMIEYNLGAALDGSNISNYATDNASGDFAARRNTNGMYTPVANYGGETFSYPSRTDARGHDRYWDWRNNFDSASPAVPADTKDQLTQALVDGGRVPYQPAPAPDAAQSDDSGGPISYLTHALARVPQTFLGGGQSDSNGNAYPNPYNAEMGKAFLQEALAGTKAPGMGTTLGKLGMLLAGNKMMNDYAGAQQAYQSQIADSLLGGGSGSPHSAPMQAPASSGGGAIGAAPTAPNPFTAAASAGGAAPITPSGAFHPPTQDIESVYPQRTIRALLMNPTTYAQGMQLLQERQKALLPSQKSTPDGRVWAGNDFTGWRQTGLTAKPELENMPFDAGGGVKYPGYGQPVYDEKGNVAGIRRVPILQGDQPQAQPAKPAQDAATGQPSAAAPAPASAPDAIEEPPLNGTPGQMADWARRQDAKKEALKDAGKGVQALDKEINQQAEAGLGVKSTISEMRNLMQGFTPGATSETRQRLGNLFITAGVAPETVNKWLNTNVADVEAFKKQTAYLAVQAVKQMSPRGTQMEFQKFLENNPNIFMTPQGAARVMDRLEKIANEPLDKLSAWEKFRQDNKDRPDIWTHFPAHWTEQRRKMIESGAENSAAPTKPVGNAPAAPAAPPELAAVHSELAGIDAERANRQKAAAPAPAQAAQGAPAAPVKPALPQGVPVGSRFSPSQKIWQDPAGRFYSANGQPMTAAAPAMPQAQ